MSHQTKGLNTTGGSNRFRFEKLSERLQKVNVDIIHRASKENIDLIGPKPENDKESTVFNGCFLLDHLTQFKQLDSTLHFQR